MANTQTTPQNAHEDALSTPLTISRRRVCNVTLAMNGAPEARSGVSPPRLYVKSSAMARQIPFHSNFYDDEATRAMSEAFVMAWRILEAHETNLRDERAAKILKRNIADAILELAESGLDRDMMAHGAVDRIIAGKRFRAE
jgi:hypothetical protein